MFRMDMSMVGSTALCAGILYFLRYIWRRKRRTSVRNKVVLITGASSGLGEACAHVFYRAGARIILASRSLPSLQRVSSDLQKLSVTGETHEPKVLHLDLENLSSIPAVAQQAEELYGHIDILINNGGISYRGRVTDTLMDVDVKLMTVNYFGQVALTKALLPGMISRRQGHIVAVSSIQGKLAIPYRSPYSASKHALQAFFDTLRAEVGGHNIAVSVVSPGYIRTNLSLNALTADGSTHGVMDKTTESGMRPEDAARRVLEAVINRENEVILAPLVHRLVIFIRALFPNIFFLLMSHRARKQQTEMEKQK